MFTSEQIDKIAAAMSKAQLELKPAIKEMTNPAFKSKYADLAAIIEVSRVYNKFGIAIVQDATLTDTNRVCVYTRLLHDTGQWIECGPLIIPITKLDGHGVGAGTTYAKRIGLAAACAISADDDDDANAAVGIAVDQPRSVAAPVVMKPKGYDGWLLDIEATALNGIAVLTEAWQKSPLVFRKFLTDTNKPHWDKLKAKAEKVPQQQVPA